MQTWLHHQCLQGITGRSSSSLRSPNQRILTRPCHGFTIIELFLVIMVALIVAAVLLPTIGRPRVLNYGRRDSNQVRGILQAMGIWAQNNQGRYPLPSTIDVDDATLPSADWGSHNKDTTGHILSLLIFNGNISPEICVSPAESNAKIKPQDKYQFTLPGAGANALWDPNFRGTPDDPVSPNAAVPALTSDARGNNSYAHLPPIGARLEKWADTFSTTEAVFGNRGPQYAIDDAATSPDTKRWKLLDGLTGTGSNTLLIHAGRTTWEGHIAYNDGHVALETTPTPSDVRYSRIGDSNKLGHSDNLFVNELDEVAGDHMPGEVVRGRNAYLRPVTGYSSATRPILWAD